MTLLLPAVFSLLLVCFATLVLTVSGVNSFLLGRKLQGTALAHSANQAAIRIRFELNGIGTTLAGLARELNGLDFRDSAGLADLLADWQSRLHFASRLSIVGLQGETVFDQPIPDSKAGFRLDHAPLPPGLGPGFLALANTSQSPLILDLGRPDVRNHAGTLHPGYLLRVAMDWNWVTPYLDENLSHLRQDMSVDTWLIRLPDGFILSGPPEDRHQDIRLADYPGLVTHQWGWLQSAPARGPEALDAYASTGIINNLSGFGMAVILRQSMELVWLPVRQSIALFGSIAALLAALFLLLIFTASRLLAAPLVRLAGTVRHWQQDSSEPIDIIAGPREVREVSLAFRELVDRLGRTSQARIQAERQASHDPLTGLPNRLALQDYLSDPIIWEERHVFRVFLYLDLDGFKEVNDTWGHQAGDAVLKELSRRMMDSSRGETLCVRLGGDEFLVVLRLSLRDFSAAQTTLPARDTAAWLDEVHQAAAPAIRRLLESCSQPVSWPAGPAPVPLQVSGSLGCAVWPLDQADPAQVLQQADQAMYQAKRAGKNCHRWHGQPAP